MGNYQVKMESRNLYDYFYNRCKRHEIGRWRWLGDFESNQVIYSVFIISYYEFKEPHVVLVDQSITTFFNVSLLDFNLLGDGMIDAYSKIEPDFLRWVNNAKFSVTVQRRDKKRRFGYRINEIRSTLRTVGGYLWRETNPNHSRYRKLWRKYRFSKSFSYKSVHPIIDFDWMDKDKWFFTTKEIKKIGEEWFSDFEFPNMTEYRYDGAEPTGYWG